MQPGLCMFMQACPTLAVEYKTFKKPKVTYPYIIYTTVETSTRNNPIQPNPTKVIRGSCIKTDRIKLLGDLAGDGTNNGPQPWLTTGDMTKPLKLVPWQRGMSSFSIMKENQERFSAEESTVTTRQEKDRLFFPLFFNTRPAKKTTIFEPVGSGTLKVGQDSVE